MSPKDSNLPGGCKSIEEFEDYLVKKVNECKRENKSKKETEEHLFEKFKIDPRYTRLCLFRLREQNQDGSSSFIADLKTIHEQVETEKKASVQATDSLNLPGGCKSMEELAYYISKKIKELEGEKKRLHETEKHLSENFEIDPRYTRKCLFRLGDVKPHFSSSFLTDLRKIYELIEREKKTKKASEEAAQATQVAYPNANFDAIYPDGYYNMEDVIDLADRRIQECIVDSMSKEGTIKHLFEKFQIPPFITRIVWDDLQERDPEFFNWYNLERSHEQMILDKCSAKRDLARTKLLRIEKRSLKTGPSAPKRKEQISSEENAQKKQKTQHLQASTQQPVSASETESVGVLKQILTSVDKIASTQMLKSKHLHQASSLQPVTSSETESLGVLKQILTSVNMMLKLMTDAAKSEEKQPVDQEQVRGDNEEETENLQNQNQQETQKLDIPGNEDNKDNTK